MSVLCATSLSEKNIHKCFSALDASEGKENKEGKAQWFALSALELTLEEGNQSSHPKNIHQRTTYIEHPGCRKWIKLAWTRSIRIEASSGSKHPTQPKAELQLLFSGAHISAKGNRHQHEQFFPCSKNSATNAKTPRVPRLGLIRDPCTLTHARGHRRNMKYRGRRTGNDGWLVSWLVDRRPDEWWNGWTDQRRGERERETERERERDEMRWEYLIFVSNSLPMNSRLYI